MIEESRMRVSFSVTKLTITALVACVFAFPAMSNASAAVACQLDSPILIVGFEKNSSALPKNAHALIDKLVKDSSPQNCEVTITGFASGGPTREFDRKLGTARANAVAAKLSSNGYPKQLIRIEHGNGGRAAQIQLAGAQVASPDNQAEQASIVKAPSPFTTAFAVGSPIKAKPYDALLPGFWVGYDDKKKSVINVSQIKTGASDKGPYILRVAMENAAGSDWISIERTFQAGKKFKGKFRVRALANRTSPLQLALFIPRTGGKKDKQIAIGTVNIGKKYKSFQFPISIDAKAIPDMDPSQSPRIVAFLPKRPRSVVELSRFEVVPADAD